MTFKKIACAIDFSDTSQHALRVAIRMANEARAELVVAHAWYLPPPVFPIESVFPPEMIQDMIDDAKRRLDNAVRDARAAGVQNVEGTMVTGVPWAVLVTLLENQGFDVCVIGTHGRTGLSRILLGSVAEKVVRHAPCSVLAVRPNGEVKPITHALVPTDFSDSARHAADVAATLVQSGGTITLLHAIEVPVVYWSELAIANVSGDLEQRYRSVLDDEKARLRRMTTANINVRLGTGEPGVEILRALDDDRSVDLVVMGSRGRTGIKRAVLGSVAEKVVRHAHCSVLVARRRG